MVNIITPLGKLVKNTTPGVKFVNPTAFGRTFLDNFSDFFRTVGKTTPKAALPAKSTLKLPNIGSGTKTLTGLGIIGGTTLGTTLALTQTPGGQELQDNVLEFTENIGQIGENTTKFFTDNPIILPLALGIGVIIALK